jgi:hypothetical protein
MPATAISHAKNLDKNLDAKSTDSSVSAYSQKLATQTLATQKSAIQKVAKVCAMHGLPSGSPADLGTFMRALDTDKLLAMNFWSLVVKITDQINDQIQFSAHENGPTGSNTTNATLLEAIAQGVTRHSVAEVEAAGGEPKWLIQQMAAMLAGEDVQIPPAMPAPAAAATQVTPRAPAETPALVQTPPANLPEPAEAQPQPFLVPAVQTVQTDRSRLVLEHEVAVSSPLLGQRALFGSEAQEEKARPSRVPLEGYGATIATGSARKIAFALLIAVALGGGAFFVQENGAALQQKFGPSIRARYDAAWHGAKGMGGWVSSEVSGR